MLTDVNVTQHIHHYLKIDRVHVPDKKLPLSLQYKELFRRLRKSQGVTGVVMAVHGKMIDTSLRNLTTAHYIAEKFWNICDKVRVDLKDMNIENNLVALRISTLCYESTIVVGGEKGKMDYMLYVSQKTESSVTKPLRKVNGIYVQEILPKYPLPYCENPVPDYEKLMFGTTEKVPQNLFDKKKSTLWSVAETQRKSRRVTFTSKGSSAGSGSSSLFLLKTASSKSTMESEHSNVETKPLRLLDTEMKDFLKQSDFKSNVEEPPEEESQEIGYVRTRAERVMTIRYGDGPSFGDVEIGASAKDLDDILKTKWEMLNFKKARIMDESAAHQLEAGHEDKAKELKDLDDLSADSQEKSS